MVAEVKRWLLFQPCWTSKKKCPWFIHHRIHYTGDIGRSKSACLERLRVCCRLVSFLFVSLKTVFWNHCSAVPWLIQMDCAGNLARWTPRARRCWRAALSWNPTAKRASKSVLRRAGPSAGLEGPMMIMMTVRPTQTVQVYQRLPGLVNCPKKRWKDPPCY